MEYILSDLEDTLHFGLCVGKAFSDSLNTNGSNSVDNLNNTQSSNSNSPNSTIALISAKSVKSEKNPAILPRTIYLYGDLGAGKTTFTRAFVSAFAGAENAEVASPSFTLCHEYPTTPEIYHADLYRLPNNSNLPEELQELPNNIIFILEWPERLNKESLEENRLEIHFCIEEDEDKEEMSVEKIPTEEIALKKNPVEKLDNFENSCEKKRRVRISIHGKETIFFMENLKKTLQNCLESKN